MARNRQPKTALVAKRPTLILNIDVATMTLADIELFEPGGFTVGAFRSFMARYSNWQDSHISTLTMEETKRAVSEITKAIRAASVPKSNAAP